MAEVLPGSRARPQFNPGLNGLSTGLISQSQYAHGGPKTGVPRLSVAYSKPSFVARRTELCIARFRSDSASSAYIRNLAALVICYGMSINIVEVWARAGARVRG